MAEFKGANRVFAANSMIFVPGSRADRFAKAKAAGVDTTLISTGGAKPLADGEAPRPVTSGDILSMFTKHAEPA